MNALCARFHRGRIAATVEVEHLIVVDLEADGQPLGIEFVFQSSPHPRAGRNARASAEA